MHGSTYHVLYGESLIDLSVSNIRQHTYKNMQIDPGE